MLKDPQRIAFIFSEDDIMQWRTWGTPSGGGKRPKQTKKAMLIFTSGERASKKKSLGNVWYINWYCCKLGWEHSLVSDVNFIFLQTSVASKKKITSFLRIAT